MSVDSNFHMSDLCLDGSCLVGSGTVFSRGLDPDPFNPYLNPQPQTQGIKITKYLFYLLEVYMYKCNLICNII